MSVGSGYTVEDWYNHQISIYYRKNNENKNMDKCRKQYNSYYNIHSYDYRDPDVNC